MEIDPVCGMQLDPVQADSMLDYQGRKYYFCSRECLERFRKQPEIFTNKAPAMRLTIGVMGSASHDQPHRASLPHNYHDSQVSASRTG
ncbi:MAG TPA: YHS domain-containing protein [Chromatiales bacterium]|nr:YHS domain-containing protein [Chromatiales bacterium]